MKNLITLAVFFVLTLFSVNAQQIKLGVKAGVNFATITGDTEGVDSRTSFHAGAVAEFSLVEKLFLQPELLYSSQGAKSGSPTDELKLDYLNIPVLAKYFVAEGFSIEVGPQIGFILSAKEEYDGTSEDVKDSLKSTDFGLNFGIAYEMKTGLNFDARYYLGLSNISDVGGSGNFKNGVFQISIGYFFLN